MDKKTALRFLREEKEALRQLQPLQDTEMAAWNLRAQACFRRIYGEASREYQDIYHGALFIDPFVNGIPIHISERFRRFTQQQTSLARHIDAAIATIERFGPPKSSSSKVGFLSSLSADAIAWYVVIGTAIAGVAIWGTTIATSAKRDALKADKKALQDSIAAMISRPLVIDTVFVTVPADTAKLIPAGSADDTSGNSPEQERLKVIQRDARGNP